MLAYATTYAVAAQVGDLPPVSAPSWFLVSLAIVAVPAWIAVFTAYHLYENDSLKISVASFDEVRDIFHAMLAGSLIFLVLSQGLRHLAGWWVYSAVEAALFLISALVLVPLARGSIRSWVFPRLMQSRRTLIVGSGAEAKLVHRKLQAHPEYGLEVVGFLNGRRDGELGPILGAPSDVAEVVDELEIDRVLLASSVASHEEMLDLVRTVRRPDVQVSIVPRYFEIFTSHATLDDVEGMPVVTLAADAARAELPAAEARLRHLRLRPGARPALAAPRGDRARDPPRQPGPGASTASRAAAATAARSRSSSSARCSSAPRSSATPCAT